MSGPDLAALQTWMQGRVMAGPWQIDTPGADGVAAGTLIVTSDALSAEARLGIYATSYVQRLAECLRTEFPLLRALIGDQVFNLFAGGYLSARPSSSTSLYDLGAGFADYLAATRPQPSSGPGTPEALPENLARLERALAEAEREAGVEDAAADAIDVIALLHDPDARLRTPPSLRLLRLEFDFSGTLASARDGQRPPMPTPHTWLVAVARSEYRVRAHTQEPWEFAFLAALGESGVELHAASQAAARASGRDQGAILASLLMWLPLAVAAGFAAVARSNRAAP